MSQTEKLWHIHDAKNIAVRMCDTLQKEGLAQRVEIAGSIRRKIKEVGDIELVIIPAYHQNLFGDLDTGRNPVITYLRSKFVRFMKGNNDDARYCQIVSPAGIKEIGRAHV